MPPAASASIVASFPYTNLNEAVSDTPVDLRANKTVPYGELMEIMNLLRAAGYLNVALVGAEKASGP